jgi:hypothetical protein
VIISKAVMAAKMSLLKGNKEGVWRPVMPRGALLPELL